MSEALLATIKMQYLLNSDQLTYYTPVAFDGSWASLQRQVRVACDKGWGTRLPRS